MVSGRSAPRASRSGLPLSRLSSAVNSSCFCSIRSASLLRSRPRSEAFILGQGPSSKALRAALTARSTSALSPSATWQMVSPVAGLMVGNVLPETLSSHLPPIKSGWSLTLGGLTVRGFSAVAVAMRDSPQGKEGRGGADPFGSRPAWIGAPVIRWVKEGTFSREAESSERSEEEPVYVSRSPGRLRARNVNSARLYVAAKRICYERAHDLCF